MLGHVHVIEIRAVAIHIAQRRSRSVNVQLYPNLRQRFGIIRVVGFVLLIRGKIEQVSSLARSIDDQVCLIDVKVGIDGLDLKK